MLPFVALTLTWAGARFLGLEQPEADFRDAPRWRQVTVGTAGVLIVLVTAFFYPIWTAMVVPFWFWQLHMWMPSWV